MIIETDFVYPQETWNAAKCEKLLRRCETDGLGTTFRYPKGYVGDLIGKSQRFNGGTIIDGNWHPGVIYPLPILPEGYEFYTVPSRGRFIRKAA